MTTAPFDRSHQELSNGINSFFQRLIFWKNLLKFEDFWHRKISDTGLSVRFKQHKPLLLTLLVWLLLFLKCEASRHPKRIEARYWHHLKAEINSFQMMLISRLNLFWLPRYWSFEFQKKIRGSHLFQYADYLI